MKRIFCIILVLALLLPSFPAANAKDADELNDLVAARYDSFAASIRQTDADEKALDDMLEAALYGDGSDLYFDESDALTSALFESNLFRSLFLEAVPAAVREMQSLHEPRLLLAASLVWYDHVAESSCYIARYNDTALSNDDMWYTPLVFQKQQNITPNKCDTLMTLIVGSSNLAIRIHPVNIGFEEVTYRIEVQWTDRFNFDGGYDEYDKKGYDTGLAKLLTTLGPILRLNSFFWQSNATFCITVPNSCAHSCESSYRWENVEGTLTACQSAGALTKHIRQEESADTPKYYYTLDQTIMLRHDIPWRVEFAMEDKPGFYLGSHISYAKTWHPAIYMGTTRTGLLEANHRHNYDDFYGPKYDYIDWNIYGLDYLDYGITKGGCKTYLLENRVAPDGSNMIWLAVDGIELGPITQRTFYDGETKQTAKSDGVTDASGKDIPIRYIYNYGYYYEDPLPLVYLQIQNPGSCPVTETVAPTCSTPGGTATKCILCGAVDIVSPGEKLPHTPKTVAGYAPTCTEEGLTEGSECADCGEVLVEQQAIPMLEHTPTVVSGFAPTCKDKGLTEGSKCGVCNKVLVHQEAIPSTGHTFEAMPNVPATCTEEGSSGGSWCPTCEKIMLPPNVLPALGHKYKNGICKNCGEADPDKPIVPGDADGDGNVTYMDAMAALQMAVGLLDQNPACDMDADNTVTYLDAMAILRLAVGLN